MARGVLEHRAGDHGIRAGNHQGGVPVVEPHEVRGPAAEALDLDDDSAPVRFTNGIPVHQEPIAYRRPPCSP